jgi:hypothetical protein
MTPTPSIKRQLTIAAKFTEPQMKFNMIRQVFARHMPSEQAKHATRAHLATR